MKPEKPSDYYTILARAVAKKLDDATSMKKAATKILMTNIGNRDSRDMSINECMVICHGLPYVEYSRTPQIANLRAIKKHTVHEGHEGQHFFKLFSKAKYTNKLYLIDQTKKWLSCVKKIK